MTGDHTGSRTSSRVKDCGTAYCVANERGRCRWRSDVERCTQWEPDSSGLLWKRLRRGDAGGLRFLRHYSVGELTIDFYCPKKRLAIELERPCRHEDRRQPSRERQMIIDYFGVTFLKVTNSELQDDMEGVLARIERLIDGPCGPGGKAGTGGTSA